MNKIYKNLFLLKIIQRIKNLKFKNYNKKILKKIKKFKKKFFNQSRNKFKIQVKKTIKIVK